MSSEAPERVWLSAPSINREYRYGRYYESPDSVIPKPAVEYVRADVAAKGDVELAQVVIEEAGDCDDCERVALWDRQDDPETHWEACDEHKGDSLGWVERKAVRMAQAVLAKRKAEQ